MAYGTINADLMTTSDGVSSSGLYGFKNRIINGAMVIDQRNAGASVSSSGSYPVDRFNISNSVTSFTAQQSSTAPSGFVKSLLYTSVTGGSAASTDRLIIRQRIEGFNWADLGWGSASAQTVTLSFAVRSSLTGTFSGSLRNDNEDRSYPFSFTISAANTFENKSITITGDTTGTWLTTNGTGVQLSFDMGSGSSKRTTAGAWASGDYVGVTGAVSVSATTGATFYITGVQLEKGSTATSFDYRPYGTELQLCQRYYYRIKHNGVGATIVANSYNYSSDTAVGTVFFPVTMRTYPTALEQSGTASDYYINYGASTVACTSVPTQHVNNSVNNASVAFNGATGSVLTQGQGSLFRIQGGNGYLGWSAEL